MIYSWDKLLIIFLVLLPILYCPGPMTLFCMSYGIAVGHKRSLFCILGGSTGYLIQVSLVLLGINEFVNNKIIIKSVLYIGAAYIGYLSWKWFFTKRISNNLNLKSNHTSAVTLYSSGLLVAVSNPKGIIVYLSIFPKFIDHYTDYLPQYVTLAIMFLITQFMSGLSYAFFGGIVFKWMEKNKLEVLVSRIIGLLLLLVALALLII